MAATTAQKEQSKQRIILCANMLSAPLVSIIVPVFNAIPFLRNTVNSILNQTFSDFELVLIDDGSTDGSSDICDEYVLSDNRVKVIHQINTGVSAARNRGISVAKGRFVTFIDADDLVHPSLIETLYAALIDNDADFSMIRVIMTFADDAQTLLHETFEKGIDLQIINMPLYYERMLHHSEDSFVVSVGKLFRVEKIRDLKFVGTLGEDQNWIAKQIRDVNKVVFANFPMYYWIQHATSATHQKMIKGRIDFLHMLFDLYNGIPISLELPRSWCLERLYRRIIHTRYLAKGTSFERDAEQEIHGLYKQTHGLLLHSQLSMKTKCLLVGLYHFPFFYRSFMWLCNKRYVFNNYFSNSLK